MKFLNVSIRVPTPTMSPAKDPLDLPGFKGPISRWVWRIYTQRLTSAGRWFALVSMAFLSYSGASLQLQGFVPAAYVAAIWAVAAAGMLISRPRVAVRVRVSEKAVVGTLARMDVEVTGTSRRHSGLGDLYVIPHRLPREIDAEPEAGGAVDMGADGRGKASVGLRCNRRGAFVIRGVRAESGFPFGILRSRRTFLEDHRLTVYPRFDALTRLTLPTGRRYQPGGVALASEIGESFEYLGNREYREGDNPRDIDWRATARLGLAFAHVGRRTSNESSTGASTGKGTGTSTDTRTATRAGKAPDARIGGPGGPGGPGGARGAGAAGAAGAAVIGGSGGGLVVREWVEEYMLRVAVVLDTQVAEEKRWTGRSKAGREGEEAFERAVSVAAAVSDYMARNDYLVDLFAAGPDVYHLTAGRSLAYLDQILEILACVEGSPRAMFAEIEPKLAELFDRLSTVILVLTAWDDERRDFAESLRTRGVAVKVIVMSPDTPTASPASPASSVTGDDVTFVTREQYERGLQEL